jgi:hypothetical protein
VVAIRVRQPPRRPTPQARQGNLDQHPLESWARIGPNHPPTTGQNRMQPDQTKIDP